MANLDIKDSFLSGPELKILTRLLKGNRALAIGYVVEFWELAQEYWARGQLVPKTAFEALDLPAALYDPTVGLAEWRDGGIYARGSSEHFNWLRDRRESGRLGGIASGKVRKSKSNDSNAHSEANREAPPQAQEPPIPIPIPIPKNPVVPCTSQKPKMHRLALIWNLYRGSDLPEVKKCGPERMRNGDRLWKEEPSEQYWIEVVKRVSVSPLATGKGTSGWVMDFDFFLKPETHTRILEGKYELKFQQKAQGNAHPMGGG